MIHWFIDANSKLRGWIAHAVAWVTAFFGAMTIDRAAILIGIITTILLFFHSIWCRHQHLKMAREAINQGRIDCATCEKVQGET